MAFTFKLENQDGTPADPPTLQTTVPNWSPGDTIPLGRDRTLRVIEVRHGEDVDVLIVERGRGEPNAYAGPAPTQRPARCTDFTLSPPFWDVQSARLSGRAHSATLEFLRRR
jgi:hypothetical protein